MENEKENKFLVAVDLKAVNVTDKVDIVAAEKADRSTGVNKHRSRATWLTRQVTSLRLAEGITYNLRHPVKCDLSRRPVL